MDDWMQSPGMNNKEETAVISIDIISGFLGAGKTTLINKLLAEAYISENPVLIENEFGDVGIDDSLIENPEIQVRLLASGCICCTLASGFVQGIKEVAEKYNPTRIIVEPTGLANPTDVLAACLEAGKSVPLKVSTLITVANATNIIPLLAVGGTLFTEQLTGAEIILLSCTQLLTQTELTEVIEAVQTLNPHCPILDCNWKDLDSLALLSMAEEERVQKSGEVCQVCRHVHNHEHEHSLQHGTEAYSSLAFFPEHPYTETQAQTLLTELSRGRYGDILRAKGFLRRPGSGFYRIGYVYGRGELLPITYEGQSKFVIIGRKLNLSALSELMEKEL